MINVPRSNWNSFEFDLDAVEEIAEDNNMIASEQELSDVFDAEIAPMVLEHYDADDHIAFNEAFNDWVDGLQKDGLIHELQADEYTYIGKYSD